MQSTFNKISAKRRSIYALGDQVTASPEEIFDLVKTTVRNSPSAFNSQTVRAVILFSEKSDRVWQIVEDTLKEIVKDPAAFEKKKQKLQLSVLVMELFYT